MWSCVEENVIGSQSADGAVVGDVVNYSCQISCHGAVFPVPVWEPPSPDDSSLHLTALTDSFKSVNRSTTVRMPDGPANISRTCRLDYNASWSADYVWQSSAITVSCQYKTLFCISLKETILSP